jgi:hypothetical protein
VPFTNEQLIQAITLDYSSRYDDGKGDVEVEFNDDKLSQPSGVDPAQQTLPGIPAVEPHERLTEEMRDGLTKAIDKTFNMQAESAADEVDPPDFSDSIAEYQQEHWSSKDDDDKFEWAESNADEYLGSDDAPESSGDTEISEDEADALRTLVSSNDPKALWAIADSKHGKELLLGSDWTGVIDLRDKDTMERFNAYISKAKKGA